MASIHFYGHPQHTVIAQWAINTDCIPKTLRATGQHFSNRAVISMAQLTQVRFHCTNINLSYVGIYDQNTSNLHVPMCRKYDHSVRTSLHHKMRGIHHKL